MTKQISIKHIFGQLDCYTINVLDGFVVPLVGIDRYLNVLYPMGCRGSYGCKGEIVKWPK